MSDQDFAISREGVTLSSRLVAAIREAILNGRLPPGRHLKERELCDMFQVSRSLVREAVQKLAAEELVTLVPHRGLTVSRIDRQSARDLYKVRTVLEGLAFAEFTERADAAARDELFRLAARLGELGEGDPPQALLDAKNAFYACVMEGCGNRVLRQMFTQLNNRVVQLRRISMSRPGRLPETRREIDAIVAAVRRRDAQAARRAAEQHVASAARVADLRFEELEREAEGPAGA
jgi:DNA-binding GntR family transcriptional regulator